MPAPAVLLLLLLAKHCEFVDDRFDVLGDVLLHRVVDRPSLLRHAKVVQLDFLLWEARADSAKAREELGVDPVEWPEAIRRTVRWMLDEGRV